MYVGLARQSRLPVETGGLVCLNLNLWALWCVLHRGHSNS